MLITYFVYSKSCEGGRNNMRIGEKRKPSRNQEHSWDNNRKGKFHKCCIIYFEPHEFKRKYNDAVVPINCTTECQYPGNLACLKTLWYVQPVFLWPP